MDILREIERMLNENGADLYGGEAVTQTEHALQCAALAEAQKASHYLVIAALLHDIGHLLEPDFANSDKHDKDLHHEDLGEAFLEKWFDDSVVEPVKLHVAAKRYLCTKNEGYFSKLSPASVRSLQLQGGKMSEQEVKEFENYRYYRDALRLRAWDDLAKEPEQTTPSVSHYMTYDKKSFNGGKVCE